MTDETIDSELRRFVVQYEAAWATHDADVLSGLFTDDADIISGPEPRVAGRKAIREWWAAYFEHVEPGVRMGLTVSATRLLRPDVAVVEVVASRDDLAGAGPRARGTWVVVRANGEWKVAALRAIPPEGGAGGPPMRRTVKY